MLKSQLFKLKVINQTNLVPKQVTRAIQQPEIMQFKKIPKLKTRHLEANYNHKTNQQKKMKNHNP